MICDHLCTDKVINDHITRRLLRHWVNYPPVSIISYDITVTEIITLSGSYDTIMFYYIFDGVMETFVALFEVIVLYGNYYIIGF